MRKARSRSHVPSISPDSRRSHSRPSEAAEARLALEAGDALKAEAICRKGLGLRTDAELEFWLGEAVLRQGRRGEALACYIRAAGLACEGEPLWVDAAYKKGRLLLAVGKPAEAAETLEPVARHAPENPEVHRWLGVARRRRGDIAGAETSFRRAFDLAPGDIETAVDAAWFLEEVGKHQAALDVAVRICETSPREPRVVRLRSVIERRQGRHRQLIEWLREQIKADDGNAALWREMAHTVAVLDGAKSVPIYREALKRSPDDFEATADLANRLQRTRGPEEAKNIEEAYALAIRALEIVPKPTEKTKELHEIFTRVADHERLAALGDFEFLCKDWTNKGQVAGLHALLGQVAKPEDRILLMSGHRLCGDKMQAHADLSPLPPRPAVIGRAKIRLGFMSSDLRNHPVSYFAWPLLEQIDRSKFEIYCYSWASPQVDPIQKRIAEKVDVFRHEPVIGNRDAAMLIANDDLDMLFELGGSTHMNKLDVMAWRPAKRQASWLGYPHSAGLDRIDRLLVDPYTRPAYANLMLEKPFQLQRSWVCMTAPGFGQLPAIAEKPPFERKGYVTFGTMNNPYKYNPELLRTWAEIMRAVPGSRLLFVRPEGGAPSFRRNLSRLFEAEGIDGNRLLFIPVRGDHLRHYNEMDISLDTFPQTGGTTTCETLFMGVPVVTLAGLALFERLSYSNLVNAGLPELVAYSRESYVATAVRLAGDPKWRESFRNSARQRILSNPLGRPDLFARDFEQAALAWMDEEP